MWVHTTITYLQNITHFSNILTLLQVQKNLNIFIIFYYRT